MTDRKVVLVVGAGDATGGAIARRFAREGFTACVARRNADKLAPLLARIEAEGGRARAFGSDARREEQMVALVETIEREEGAIEVAAFNIARVPHGAVCGRLRHPNRPFGRITSTSSAPRRLMEWITLRVWPSTPSRTSA